MQCNGCAHQDNDAPNKEETACRLCSRNLNLDSEEINEVLRERGWDKLELSFPLDMYIAMDRLLFLDILAERDFAEQAK